MKISVITINYNNSRGLSDTITSVIEQTYKEIEFVIIDGGSTDGSKGIIAQNSEYIAFWVSEPDKGIYNAMNKGIEHASGEYCIFMNSGDCFENPRVIEDVVNAQDGADLVCGHTIMSDGTKIAARAEITFEGLFEHAICHQSCFIRTSLMKKHMYDESLKIVADRKFFLQALILDNCSYQAVDVDVVKYDITGFSAQNPVVSRLEYAKVLEELIPERIRVDYGRKTKGTLYGDSAYDKLFSEIRLREYRKPIYKLTVLLLSLIAKFKKSASFVYNFPKTTE